MSLSNRTYWTFDGLNITWSSADTADEHMVKMTGGTGWRITNAEIWGAHSWANVLVAGDPDKWSIDHSSIHDNYGSRSEERRVGKECRYWRDWSSDVCSSDLPTGRSTA